MSNKIKKVKTHGSKTKKVLQKHQSLYPLPDYKIRDVIGGIVHYFDVYNRKQSDTTKYLITTVFFKIPGTDQESFDTKYMHNFKTLVEDVGIKLPQFKLRVYCDDTIFKDIAYILANKYVEIFKYHIPRFYDKQSKAHFSNIGSMVRFLPMFNLANHTAEIVVNLDIDNSIFTTSKIIMRCIRENQNLCYRTRYCYSVLKRTYRYFEYEYPIIASFIYINTKLLRLSAGILAEFYTKCILSNDRRYTSYIDYVSSVSLIPIGKYDYGVDEYFLNTYLLRHIYKYRIPYYVYIHTSDSHNFLTGYIPHVRNLAANGKINISGVNKFIDLLSKTIGITVPPASATYLPSDSNVFIRLDTLFANLVPFGKIQPVVDHDAKSELAKFIRYHGSKAHIIPNLQKCIFNNLNFDKTADVIKHVIPSWNKKILG
jgi:hypothetical protein